MTAVQYDKRLFHPAGTVSFSRSVQILKGLIVYA